MFDINSHNWSDYDIGEVRVDGGKLFIEGRDYDISSVILNKQDAIAIAKHFKLTSEDLK